MESARRFAGGRGAAKKELQTPLLLNRQIQARRHLLELIALVRGQDS